MMDEMQTWLEKRMGHSLYRSVREFGKIAFLLVLFVIAGGLVLYLIFG